LTEKGTDGFCGPGDTPYASGARMLVAAVLLRPSLWPVAVAETLRMARPGWWHRWPLLPLPDEALWRFRLETAYGEEARRLMSPEDVRAFLRWCAEIGDRRDR
jgi:hypothetical protein